MASALNPNNQSWNIPQENNDSSLKPHLQSPRSSTFPLQSFASLGGGDAPFITNMPRVRSQLFTISTRAVMTSHSQMSVNYTAANGEDTKVQQFSSASSSVDSDIEEITFDIKPINTDKCFSPPPPMTKPAISSSSFHENLDYSSKPDSFSTLSRAKRCIHGSLDDLQEIRNSRRNDGNRRKSEPTTSSRGQMIQAANDLLVDENKHLVQTIQKLKRKVILTKVATRLALEAVRRRGKVIKGIQAEKLDKERQCAARLILHSLLLNTWRNTRRELDMRLADNVELKKSVENFALQVQVLRHCQSVEKQKAQEKIKIIQNLSEELRITKEENQIMRKQVDKMENELNSLQASSQNLIDENKVLNAEMAILAEKKEKLMQSLDWERLRSEKFSKENVTMKETLKALEVQVKDVTEQRCHWQERARCSESEAWELQMHLESKDNNIQELTRACDALHAEKMKLIDTKCQLKAELDRTTVALQSLENDHEKLLENFDNAKEERDLKVQKIKELETWLVNTRQECSEIGKELLSYKLQNVRKRREWANLLYFFVSPMDAMRRRML